MCTCPNYMIWKGDWTKNDRPKYEFIGHHEYNKILKNAGDSIPFIQVPCGKCLECRIQATRVWSDRCVLEAKNSPYNYFVTLTYDDNHLPAKNSLDPDDLKNFIKRLRRHFAYRGFSGKIRFLASGEYGSASWRPHYHIILFNCPLDDLTYNFCQEVDGKMVRHVRPPSTDNDLYFSQTIYDLWCETDKDRIEKLGRHKGQISVGVFSYDTAAYVAQYVTKKCVPEFDKGKIYDELGIYPEFMRVSNRPGIGANYFDNNDDLHFLGKLVIPHDGEAHLSAIPRYFDKLFVKKYGQNVFDHISKDRADKRHLNINTYNSSKKNADIEAKLRDYNIKKIHHLKNTI